MSSPFSPQQLAALPQEAVPPDLLPCLEALKGAPRWLDATDGEVVGLCLQMVMLDDHITPLHLSWLRRKGTRLARLGMAFALQQGIPVPTPFHLALAHLIEGQVAINTYGPITALWETGDRIGVERELWLLRGGVACLQMNEQTLHTPIPTLHGCGLFTIPTTSAHEAIEAQANHRALTAALDAGMAHFHARRDTDHDRF